MQTTFAWLAFLLFSIVGSALALDADGNEKVCDYSELGDSVLRQRLKALPAPVACRAWARLRDTKVPEQDYSHIQIDEAGHIRYVDLAPPPLPEPVTP